MKVEIIRMPKMTIEEFADQHNITMTVTETASGKFTAGFKFVREGARQVHSTPQDTIQNAISTYAEGISGKIMRVDGVGDVAVPSLTVAGFYS